MFVELHLLQNFAPSNLNRDDTGAPKDCTFGGVSRARISSQSQKRFIRQYVRERKLLPQENLGERSKLVVDEVTRRLVERGRDDAGAHAAVTAAMNALGFKVDADSRESEYLLFLGDDELDRLADACNAHFDAIAKSVAPAESAGRGRGVRSGAQGTLPKDVIDALDDVLRKGSVAADLAMYGRMLANRPDRNIDAASQVAHAISTHQVSPEFDYFTAVDDLKPPEADLGAGMIGTVEFNSACYYRYATVDVEQLAKNLEGNPDLARRALHAFLEAGILALPTAKQNSFAALNPPACVLTVVRDRRQPCSLANAFEQPVTAPRGGSLVAESVARLADAFIAYEQMYEGYTGIVARYACAPAYRESLKGLAESHSQSVRALVEQTVAAASTAGAAR